MHGEALGRVVPTGDMQGRLAVLVSIPIHHMLTAEIPRASEKK